ncbi:hypothetical protein [Veronia pacifica]|uniref:Uncharacterized protein n=1 Tax=Veronia pacifica TaxID=1080227 RepID=A0A1C3EIA7_9GAMM|nr:hypothetical protein [Veronia pacifica]ODA32976.1 hypothetical protein A8L45_11800 [Veronia pacifica]
MTERIPEEQAQELSDFIAKKCIEMELEPEQILDGLARVLLGVTNDLGAGGFDLDIEGFGKCSVELET